MMDSLPILLPYPRRIKLRNGIHHFSDNKLILLDHGHNQSLLFSATLIKNRLLAYHEINYEIYASKAIPKNRIGIILRQNKNHGNKPQSYSLRITPEYILVEAQSDQGLFYGCCTLIQIIQYYKSISESDNHTPSNTIPCLDIADWPDYIHRGVLIDISRDKVPNLQTLFDLVDLLSSWKINQLQLYTEHTFAYQQHPEVWIEASPFTGEEILKLDVFCRERYIELVPNQNSFGHLEHWLKHPRYKELAEAPNGFDFPWGHSSGPFSLNPINPKSIKFVSNLYDELLPHFTSRQVNVGCDETFDLGQGRSKRVCAEMGTGRVYLDFLLKIYKEVTSRGFTMQFWGDMITSYPELIPEIPNDCIALEWGYEANHPFDKNGNLFAENKIPFYVCPGTSSWNSIAGRTKNCLNNLSNAAVNGQKIGAVGYLITDWGDNGHWQMLPVSYLGFAAGAAYSWSLESNKSIDIKSALDLFAFQDSAMKFGSIAFDLGNVYQELSFELDNSTALFEILQKSISSWHKMFIPGISPQHFNKALEIIEKITYDLEQTSSERTDNAILQKEYQITIDMLCHTCKRGLFGLGNSTFSTEYLLDDLRKIISEYKEIWILRNRIGGLEDSVNRFEVALGDYK